MGNQHIIELNGKRYDALTGKIVASDPLPSTAKSKTANSSKAVSIDGFARSKKSAQGVSKRHTNQATAHKTEPSKTLMRKTVARPKPVASSARQNPKATPLTHSTAGIDQKRLDHAKHVPKSTAVSRFSLNSPATPTQSKKSVSQKVTKATTPTVAATSVASTSVTSASLVQNAIDNAKEPTTTKLKKEKRSVRIARILHMTPRQVSFGGFAVAFMLVIGFFAYQNITTIGMRIAASRAGIHGSLPSYQPAGFAIAGGIAYNPGQVTISYKSTSDNRNFKIMQNVSEWNSQALMDNYVAANHPNNQTIQDRGKTVYIYDGSNATWVDGGIWYRIEGESQLNSDQLLNIAASL